MSGADTCYCGTSLLLNKIRLGMYKYCDFFSSGNHKWKILSTVRKEKTVSKAVSHHNNATTVAILDFILMH